MDAKDLEAAEPIRKRLEKYLVGKNFYFNPQQEVVDAVLVAMAKRKVQYGEEYCPCRRVTGDKIKDAAIICPCVYHEKELDEDGH